MNSARDFSGYRWNYPSLRWPGGAGLAVSFVLNIEEGAELALSAGDERNESRHEVNHEVVGAPDLCMESQFEYGARVGYWRVTRLLMSHGIPLTLNACARALEATPWVASDATAQGFEICCHGWRWESHAGMARGRGTRTHRPQRRKHPPAARPRAGRLAHQVLGFGEHAPAAGGARRLPLRQRRLQRRPALLRARGRQAAPGAALRASTPTTCASSTASPMCAATTSRTTPSTPSNACCANRRTRRG